jgi:hypothetical protein
MIFSVSDELPVTLTVEMPPNVMIATKMNNVHWTDAPDGAHGEHGQDARFRAAPTKVPDPEHVTAAAPQLAPNFAPAMEPLATTIVTGIPQMPINVRISLAELQVGMHLENMMPTTLVTLPSKHATTTNVLVHRLCLRGVTSNGRNGGCALTRAAMGSEPDFECALTASLEPPDATKLPLPLTFPKLPPVTLEPVHLWMTGDNGRHAQHRVALLRADPDLDLVCPQTTSPAPTQLNRPKPAIMLNAHPLGNGRTSVRAQRLAAAVMVT